MLIAENNFVQAVQVEVLLKMVSELVVLDLFEFGGGTDAYAVCPLTFFTVESM